MTPVYLVRRNLKNKKRNGQREYRWILRWEAADGWRCESTGTADRTAAEALQKAKWAALNVPGFAPPEPPAPEPIKATWQDCRDALQRAMEADNLRPSYVSDAVAMLDRLRRAFPAYTSPAAVTAADANEFKRRLAEEVLTREKRRRSSWSLRSDLATIRAVYSKWLVRECGLVPSNPFAAVRPPKCDELDVRIVTVAEQQELADWFNARWKTWRLPLVYLELAKALGWRATELASIRTEDMLEDGFVRVVSAACKTRRHKYGCLPAGLYESLAACSADGWAFGRFADELRRRLLVVRRAPHQAAQVKSFEPSRLVHWLQEQFQAFQAERTAAAKERGEKAPEGFTIHDFRRTAITAFQQAGVSEKETSLLVGATPGVIRKHYEKIDQLAVARKAMGMRQSVSGSDPAALIFARPLRAADSSVVDDQSELTQTATA